MSCSTIIKKIKVTGSLEDTVVQNALTFTSGLLEWGGPLVHDTDVTGGYSVNFGSTLSFLKEINFRATSQIALSYNNGINSGELKIGSSGFTLEDNIANKGLTGLGDYSANYVPFSFVQKAYVDRTIVGKPISAILQSPNNSQNGYSITWNNTTQQFTLSSPGSVTAGSDKQVIFNSFGNLIGTASFTYDINTEALSAPVFNVGTIVPGGATTKTIQVISDQTNAGLTINPKGISDLSLGIRDSGRVVLGNGASTGGLRGIVSNGVDAQIDISLEPKGSDGVVWIGSSSETGGYRYVGARGNSANINLYLTSKGTGSVMFSGTNPVYVGLLTEPSSYRIIKSGSSITSDFAIAGNGTTSKILIGDNVEAASDRYIQANSASTNANLRINGKGTGLVAVNDVVNYKKVDIGDWDMNSFTNAAPLHGLANYKKIISVRVVIRDDTDATYTPLDCAAISGVSTLEGGVSSWNGTQVFLQRRNSGFFDQTTHQATGFNRGWMYISYEL